MFEHKQPNKNQLLAKPLIREQLKILIRSMLLTQNCNFEMLKESFCTYIKLAIINNTSYVNPQSNSYDNCYLTVQKNRVLQKKHYFLQVYLYYNSKKAWNMGIYFLYHNMPIKGSYEYDKYVQNLSRFMIQMADCENMPSKRLRLENSPSLNVILEITLHHINLGLIAPAYERLANYILIFPYNESAILIGYAGVISYMLCKNADYPQIAEQHFKQALYHLQMSLSIDPLNVMFLMMYLEVKIILLF